MQLNLKTSSVGSTMKGGMGTSTPTYTTYNSRYPGFDENDYKKLESLAISNGLTGQAKTSFMDSAYQQYYPQVYNNHKLNERQIQINNSVAENGNAIINGDKATQWKLRLTDLSQKAKQSKGIAYDVDDMEVINAMKTGIPNGEQLLLNYLNNGDREIFYQAGIEEDPREALKEDFWNELFSTMKVKASVPIDSFKKFAKEHFSRDAIVKQMANIGGLEMQYMGGTTQEDLDRMEGYQEEARGNIIDYNTQVNEAYQQRVAKNLNPVIQDYYDANGYTKLLTQGDFRGFILKGLGDAAENWDMPIIIGASVFQPEVGFALMGTDTYMREYQEAFDSMYATARDQGMSEKDAYEVAEQGGVAVGLINAAVEVGLERLIGGVETTASNQIRKIFMKNVQEEAVKMGLGGLLVEGAKTQLKSSAEEGLEEVVQQIVQNAAQKTLNENQELFEGTWQAFEGGFYNPMNLLAGGSNITQNLQANKDTIRQSIMDGAYNAGVRAGQLYNAVTPKNDLMTRAIPEKMVEGELKLTPTERARVEKTGITAANFMLQEGLAGETKEDMVTGLANVGADGYNKITTTFRDVIPQSEKIESKDAQKMLNTMVKVIESSDILSEEYADYLATIKQLSTQTEFDPYVALAIKRDFDALVGHDIYNNKGQVMRGEEKKAIAKWRSNLSEALNKLGDKYGVDVRAENNRIMNSITIRDGLLRSMSQNSKNNFLGLTDLGFGALLSSGNPVQAVAMVGLRKYAKNKAGNVAQYLYNLNDKPLQKVTPSKGVQFKTNMEKDANGLSLGTIVNNTTPTTVQQEGITSFDNVPDVDVGNSPLGLIPDTDVGSNPTDIVNSENVNEKAGNSAQELYNQSDNNLSDNPTDMTEQTKPTFGDGFAEQNRLSLIQDVKDMDYGDRIKVKEIRVGDDVNYTYGYTIERVEAGYRIEFNDGDAYFEEGEMEDFLDKPIFSYEVEQQGDYMDGVEPGETDMKQLEENNPEEYGNLMDEEYELEQSRQEEANETKPNQYKYDRLQKDLEKANSEFRKLMAEYNRTGIKEYKKNAEKQQKEIIRLNKEIDAITWEWNEQQRREEYNNWNDRVTMENDATIALNEDTNSPVGEAVKSYTAEELGLPPVSKTMLKNLDRSKYIPVEDPKTKKVVFYKVEELKQIPITQNGKLVTWDEEGNMVVESKEDIMSRTAKEREQATKNSNSNQKFRDQAEAEWRDDWYLDNEEGDIIWVDRTDDSNVQTEGEHIRWVKDRAEEIKDTEGVSNKEAIQMAEQEWDEDREEETEQVGVWRDYTDDMNTQSEAEHKRWVENRTRELIGEAEKKATKKGDTLDWLDKVSDKEIQKIDEIIKKTLSKEEYNTWKDKKGNVSEGRALFSRLTNLFGYDKTSSILKEAGYDAYSSDDKLYKFENGKTYKENQPNDYDRAKETKYTEMDIDELREYAENGVIKKYLPDQGEGNSKASQLATAVNKLIRRYYNDGDRYTEDYAGEVASYANWIEEHAFELPTDDDYEENLRQILIKTIEKIDSFKNRPTVDSVYDSKEGKWTYEEPEEEDGDDRYYSWADSSYKPSITMRLDENGNEIKSNKKTTKKSQKEAVNNLISDTWHDIGDEGDWDWYKKMKKKDVIAYLEDQVGDEFSDARKRGYDYGLEWSEVQKLIKKFVNDKFSNEKKVQEAVKNPKPFTMSDDELMAFSRSMRYKK